MFVHFLVLTSTLTSVLGQANFANDLAVCVEEKPINQCLKETLNELRTLMPIGIPELGLRRSEPFEIDNLNFNSEPGLVDVRARFSNVVVRGLSSFITREITADIDTQTLRLNMLVPRMHITGNYDIDGNVIIVPVKGNGDFTTTLEGVTGIGQANIVPVSTPQGQRLIVTNTDIDFNIARAQVRMNNLFNGELPSLARHVNGWISDNSGLVIDAVKPQIRRETINIVERVINDAFSKVPAGDFLKNLERNARGGRTGRTRTGLAGRPVISGRK